VTAIHSIKRAEVAFGAMWLGQLVSVAGSVLTEFALGVWVFQRTGSATLFALITIFIVVPPILFATISGALADRHSRRQVMILANLAGGLTTLLLAVLLTTGQLNVVWAYIVTLLFALASTGLLPAFEASIPMLIEDRHLGRANGMVQFALSFPRVISPPIGAFLLGTIGLRGIALIDGATFLFAIGTLMAIAIPQPSAGDEERRGLLAEAADGLRYIVPRRGLLLLLLFFAVINIDAGLFVGLFTPLVLSFASAQELGFAAGLGSIGLIVSAVLASVWGGPRRRVQGVLVCGMLLGLSLGLMGARPSLALAAAGCFAFSVFAIMVDVVASTIWQSTVPPELQGRVHGTIRTVSFSTVPLAILIGGPLVDRVLNPLFVPGGALAGTVGQVIGVGPGRGIGFLMLVAGLIPILAGITLYLMPALRELERRPEQQVPAPQGTA
jgi:MFS family permease